MPRKDEGCNAYSRVQPCIAFTFTDHPNFWNIPLPLTFLYFKIKKMQSDLVWILVYSLLFLSLNLHYIPLAILSSHPSLTFCSRYTLHCKNCDDLFLEISCWIQTQSVVHSQQILFICIFSEIDIGNALSLVRCLMREGGSSWDIRNMTAWM